MDLKSALGHCWILHCTADAVTAEHRSRAERQRERDSARREATTRKQLSSCIVTGEFPPGKEVTVDEICTAESKTTTSNKQQRRQQQQAWPDTHCPTRSEHRQSLVVAIFALLDRISRIPRCTRSIELRTLTSLTTMHRCRLTRGRGRGSPWLTSYDP